MTTPRGERPAMVDYGVDTEEWEALPWSWAQSRLDGNRNFWVVTVSASGRPHSLPVWGVWDESSQRFMFSCAPSSRKAANLRSNNQVVVTIDDTVHCVSIEGVAEIVTSDSAKDSWADLYLEKYLKEAPELTREFIVGGVVVEVAPSRAFGIIENDETFSTRATRWVFGD